MKARMERENAAPVRRTEVDVFVMSFGSGLLEERMAVTTQLWNAGIKVSITLSMVLTPHANLERPRQRGK